MKNRIDILNEEITLFNNDMEILKFNKIKILFNSYNYNNIKNKCREIINYYIFKNENYKNKLYIQLIIEDNYDVDNYGKLICYLKSDYDILDKIETDYFNFIDFVQMRDNFNKIRRFIYELL